MPNLPGPTAILDPIEQHPPRRRGPSSAHAIGDRITRHLAPFMREAPPFVAFEPQPTPTGRAAATSLRPTWTRSKRGRKHLWLVEINTSGTDLYGTGEHAGRLKRNGTRKLLYNHDRGDYTEHSPSLYQAHPWVLGVRPDGSAFGVIIESTWRMWLDLRGGDRPGIIAEVEGPAPAVTIIERDDPAAVVEALADLTGKPPMRALWTLGYHQCRYSYVPQARVWEVAQQFRARKIPCDVIWLDIDYMDGFRCFTFDKETFADPEDLFRDLHQHGFKAVCMIDPGLKVDPEYPVYRTGRDGNHFVRDAAGREYNGLVWPGQCAFPDYTNAAVREWWSHLYTDFMSLGIDGVWNDMNEPAVFLGPLKSMPDTNRHEADAELGGPGPHTQYHNIYGMQMVKATREGIHRALPDRRPFVLTRANFLGGHRYAATWTGDNRSDWRHLRWSIPMALNLGLSGQPFVGPDIGGFVGEADGELFARWMGIGALLPFARGHTVTGSADHEPWSFGEECEAICKAALERRYRLLPYLYTLLDESARTGLPIVRPLFFANPRDAALRSRDDAFLLGADLLVCPRLEPAKARRGVGSDVNIERTAARLGWNAAPELDDPADQLPRLFQRPGSIIPLGPIREFVDQKPLDPLTLMVAVDDRGEARGTLYEDAGDGWEFQHGHYRRATCHAKRSGGSFIVEFLSSDGSFEVPPRALNVALVDTTGEFRRGEGVDGHPVIV